VNPTWDWPTRAFHWTLAGAVLLSWVSQEEDYLVVHQWSGYAVLVLVGFRLAWGFIGSVHSRFSDFVTGPRTVWAYLRGAPSRTRGHNPLGGYGVLVLLLLVALQALTGLFNSDGLIYDGPFYHALDSGWTDLLGEWHERLFWVLLGFIGLHLLAVAWYQYVRGRDLVGPMLHGGREGPAPAVAGWRAWLVVAVLSGLLALALWFAPEPELPW
jgi:cytochrome b